MRVYRALGTALVVTVASLACSEPPTTPTSSSSASPFAVNYTITASAGANGTISPSGAVTVSSGIQGFKITPELNYHVSDVLVDNVSVGPVVSYTFTNLAATHTITAFFAINDSVDGLYRGSLVLSGVGGGECVGLDLSRQIGAIDANTVSVTTQNQGDVTAIIRSTTSGLYCTYKGNTRQTIFATNDTSCNAEILFQCTSGASRILVPVASTMTASVGGNTASGVVATTYNVYAEDPASGRRVPVAGLVTQEQFTATR